jgi:hypothetical protein
MAKAKAKAKAETEVSKSLGRWAVTPTRFPKPGRFVGRNTSLLPCHLFTFKTDGYASIRVLEKVGFYFWKRKGDYLIWKFVDFRDKLKKSL